VSVIGHGKRRHVDRISGSPSRSGSHRPSQDGTQLRADEQRVQVRMLYYHKGIYIEIGCLKRDVLQSWWCAVVVVNFEFCAENQEKKPRNF